MMKHSFDCVAVPIPQSFQTPVESAILQLPVPSVVVQKDMASFSTGWQPTDDSGDDEPDDSFEEQTKLGASYVPIDPCQPVIAAIRTAMGDRIPRHFIDLRRRSFRMSPPLQTRNGASGFVLWRGN
jgi:hypothetical protein